MLGKPVLTLDDYSPEQIAIFDRMHEEITSINNQLRNARGKKRDQIMETLPQYTREQIAEYSIYRELWIAARYRLK